MRSAAKAPRTHRGSAGRRPSLVFGVLAALRSDSAWVALAALVAHARTAAFGFVGLDDRDLIVDDQAFLAHPSALWRAFGRAYMASVDAGHAYYRPLVTVSYALNAWFGGARPALYHATNVAVFAVAAVLVHRVLLRLGMGWRLALVGATAFAWHPALVSAVAWIPGRNDTLLAVFALSSWLAFLGGRIAWHLVLFALALLTKETAVALPIVCLSHVLLSRGEPRLKRLPILAAVGWISLVAVRIGFRPPPDRPAWSDLPALVGGLAEVTLPLRPSAIASAADVGWVLGAIVALLGVACALLPKVRRDVWGLGVAWYVAFSLPPLLAPGTLVLSQRLVLPAVGVLIVVCEVVRSIGPERRVLAAFSGVSLTVLAAVTLAFETTFIDRRAFAREALSAAPRCALAHFTEAQSLQMDGHDERALTEYRAALALGPTEGAHNNIAVLLMKRHAWPEAELELATELAGDPRYAKAHYNLAIVLRHEGRLSEACASARRAVSIAPDGDDFANETTRDCDAP